MREGGNRLREGVNRLRNGVNRLRNGGTCSRDSARHLQGKNEYQKLSGNRLGVGDFRIFFFLFRGKQLQRRFQPVPGCALSQYSLLLKINPFRVENLKQIIICKM